MTVLEFIEKHFPYSVMETKEDVGNRFGLPHPYTVPSPGDVFDCMFYWDTHFTNIGLIASGNIQQAIYNTDNIRHMINRFGYMPNSTKVHHLGQSQPPFYFRMVSDIYDVTQDTQWLNDHYDTIAKEYSFWMTYRQSSNGLNYYGKTLDNLSQEEINRRYQYGCSRFEGYHTEAISEKMDLINTVATLCESGWDCCYRFGMNGRDYNPVDLNTLLYALEKSMERFSLILSRGEEKLWLERAENRKKKMDRFLFSSEKGFYLDWDFKNQKHSDCISVASLFPLYLGLMHTPAPVMEVLKNELLLPYGVSATVIPKHPYHLQWEYPNIWAPLQYVAYCASKTAGYDELALEIAKRFVNLLDANFDKTGNLWEKYNGITGQVVNAEYNAPPMMGWTAGVYLFFSNLHY